MLRPAKTQPQLQVERHKQHMQMPKCAVACLLPYVLQPAAQMHMHAASHRTVHMDVTRLDGIQATRYNY
jgi:hypothetical protein